MQGLDILSLSRLVELCMEHRNHRLKEYSMAVRAGVNADEKEYEKYFSILSGASPEPEVAVSNDNRALLRKVFGG